MDQQPFEELLRQAHIRGISPKETGWTRVAYYANLVLNAVFFYLLFSFSAVNFAGVAEITYPLICILLASLVEHAVSEIMGFFPKDDQFGNKMLRRFPRHTHFPLLAFHWVNTSVTLLALGYLGLFVVTNPTIFGAITFASIVTKTAMTILYMAANYQDITDLP